MELLFSYEEHASHTLVSVTDDGAVVKVFFKDLDPEYVTVDEDFEFTISDDTLHALYVRIGGQAFSLYQVASFAGRQIEDIVNEVEDQSKAEFEHRIFYSCPGKSGRI